METGLPSVESYFELAERDLPGLFRAEISLLPQAQRQNSLTRRDTPQTTHIRLPRGTQVLRLHRASLPYSTVEMQVQQSYAEALEDLNLVPRVFATTAGADVLPRIVATRCAASKPERALDLERLIRAVTDQATKTYEGEKVSVNVCVDLADGGTSGIPIESFFEEPWAAVLGSSLTTAVLANGRGEVVGSTDLQALLGSPPSADLLAPERLLHLAEWTRPADRVALAATRSGEMYVLVGGECAFVLRSARWRGIPVEAVSSTSWFTPTGPMPTATKQAVLRSLIDASAAHHGACLGIVRPGNQARVTRLVADADRWRPGTARYDLFKSSSFLTLGRRQRLELLSMDGATLITTHGEILAAGAIVRVRSGSTGGGRTAAARALAPLGVGIKVSQDGLNRTGFVGGSRPLR